MPYNIWCGGCNNHIGMGVRYNAEKTKTGMYYTTPIYKFRMKCHLCPNHFEIQTDPKVNSLNPFTYYGLFCAYKLDKSIFFFKAVWCSCFIFIFNRYSCMQTV